MLAINHVPTIKRTTVTKFFDPISTANCIIYNYYMGCLSQDKAVVD